MPLLERYFHSAELGRRWTAPEGVLPSALGSRSGCQQGPLPWDLPEMIRMVKLVWKSKSELQATKPRGILENEDALHGFPGKLAVGCRRQLSQVPSLWDPFLSQGRKASCVDRVQGLRYKYLPYWKSVLKMRDGYAEGVLEWKSTNLVMGSACCRLVRVKF